MIISLMSCVLDLLFRYYTGNSERPVRQMWSSRDSSENFGLKWRREFYDILDNHFAPHVGTGGYNVAKSS